MPFSIANCQITKGYPPYEAILARFPEDQAMMPGNVNSTHYLSNRKNPGNTKYVFDGHWFMEIDGNC